jgi:hypothetical protein
MMRTQTQPGGPAPDAWPALTYVDWKETCATQIFGHGEWRVMTNAHTLYFGEAQPRGRELAPRWTVTGRTGTEDMAR